MRIVLKDPVSFKDEYKAISNTIVLEKYNRIKILISDLNICMTSDFTKESNV